MKVKSKHGGDDISIAARMAAEGVVSRLSPPESSTLFGLASNARQGIKGSESEWFPFLYVLTESGIDRFDRNHITALVSVLLPIVLKYEKVERERAVKASKDRLAAAGVQVVFGNSGKFSVSTTSAASITTESARSPLALERLAKK